MSSVYVLEPPTKGKVVLNTSMGPIDIELWPKEAPKAVRNFIQLCLDGYYDRTIFHRIIKSFLVQGGDPTGTGTGGESIYGAPFADEFHSRLRFNHRGLVACANAGPPHSNGSQFFITLDRCDWLDKKNTIFGKVTGDSIFNLLRIGDVETDKDDQPLDPRPTILSVEVLWSPFDDIIPRQMRNRHVSPKSEAENLDQKKKTVKKLNLLSFGEEAEEDEKELATVKEKIQSLHDVIDDPRFLKEEPQDQSSTDIEKKKDATMTVREALMKKGDSRKPIEETISDDDDDDDDNDDDGARFDARMRQQILRKRQERGEISIKEKSTNAKNAKSRSPSPSRDMVANDSQRANIEKLSIKKKGIGSEARANQMAKADVDLQLLGHAEQERRLLKLKKRRLQGRGDDTLAKLNKFKQKISGKLMIENSGVDNGEKISEKLTIENSGVDNGKDDDVSGWMMNELKFSTESSKKDGMARKDDPNEYVVVDPLLEKGKEKFNTMQAKMKRRKREWAGKSLT